MISALSREEVFDLKDIVDPVPRSADMGACFSFFNGKKYKFTAPKFSSTSLLSFPEA